MKVYGRLERDWSARGAIAQAIEPLDLTPFTEESVKEFKNVLRRHHEPVTRTILNSVFVLVMSLTGFFMSFFCSFGFATTEGFKLPNGLSTWVSLALLVFFGVLLGCLVVSSNRSDKWLRVPLIEASRPMTPFAAQSADAILRALPKAELSVEEHSGRRRIYSLLIVRHRGEEHYVMNWDKPKSEVQ